MKHARTTGPYYAEEAAEAKEIGQLCYEGYADSLGWRAPSGAALPAWARLPERERAAFRQGAQRAMQHGWKRR